MSEKPTTPDLEALIHEFVGALNHRDYDAALLFFAPDAVFDRSGVGMEVHAGRHAIRSRLW